MNRGIRDGGHVMLNLAGGVVQRVVPLRVHLSRAAHCALRESQRAEAHNHVRENLQSVLNLHPEEIAELQLRYLRFLRRLNLHKIFSTRTEPLPPWLTVTGTEYIDSALQARRGVILVTAHVGHPRLIGPALYGHGYRTRQVRIMGRNLRARATNMQSIASNSKVVKKLISNFIGNMSELHDIAAELDIRPIIGALARNECVIILGDGLRSTNFETLELLGQPYPFPTGIVRIAEVTGAAVLPVFAIEHEVPFHIAISISAEVALDRSLSQSDNVKKIAIIIDDQIRRTPHQWHRWKNCEIFRSALEWSKSEARLSEAFNSWCSRRCSEVH